MLLLLLLIIVIALTILQTSLTMHEKKPIYNTLHYLTYLQDAVVTYYDLHVTLLKEFTISSY